MPETPNFEQLARQLKALLDDHPRLVEQNVTAGDLCRSQPGGADPDDPVEA
jgi:hypothetical protein